MREDHLQDRVPVQAEAKQALQKTQARPIIHQRPQSVLIAALVPAQTRLVLTAGTFGHEVIIQIPTLVSPQLRPNAMPTSAFIKIANSRIQMTRSAACIYWKPCSCASSVNKKRRNKCIFDGVWSFVSLHRSVSVTVLFL